MKNGQEVYSKAHNTVVTFICIAFPGYAIVADVVTGEQLDGAVPLALLADERQREADRAYCKAHDC